MWNLFLCFSLTASFSSSKFLRKRCRWWASPFASWLPLWWWLVIQATDTCQWLQPTHHQLTPLQRLLPTHLQRLLPTHLQLILHLHILLLLTRLHPTVLIKYLISQGLLKRQSHYLNYAFFWSFFQNLFISAKLNSNEKWNIQLLINNLKKLK